MSLRVPADLAPTIHSLVQFSFSPVNGAVLVAVGKRREVAQA